MTDKMFVHPSVRIIFGLAFGVLLALGLTAIGSVMADKAYAADLTAQAVTVTLPGGSKVTVPDGSSIDLSSGTTSTTTAKATTKKAKTPAAVKKANKAFKKSGLKSYGSKHGWTLKSKWSKRTATKATCTREFAIPAKLQKQGKSLRMRVVQTTYKAKSGKWTTTYKVAGKAYCIKGIKKSLADYGQK